MGGRRGLSARSGHQPHRPIGDLRLLPYMTADFTVSATQRGLVLSAFSWSYALMQIPAGSLIDGFGERIMVGASAWSAHPRASGRSAPGRPSSRAASVPSSVFAWGSASARRAPTRPAPGGTRTSAATERPSATSSTAASPSTSASADARRNLVPVNNVPPLEAAIVEPVSCALNGQNLAEVAGARTILVAGAGPPRSHPHEARPGPGVPTVVPVEPNPARHAIARASGADAVPAPSGDIADRIRDIAPEGIDVVIMAIGRPEALTPYLGILAPGARVSVFAGFNSEATLRFVANDIHDNEYKIVGASSCRLENLQRIAPMIDSGRLVVKDLIGTQLPLERAADAIRLAASGSDTRVGVRARQSTSPTSTSTRPTTPPWPRFATP